MDILKQPTRFTPDGPKSTISLYFGHYFLPYSSTFV